MKNLIKFIILSFTVIQVSCNFNSKNSDVISFITDQFSNSEQYYLRGIGINDSRKKVIELEADSSLINNNENELTFKYRFPDAQSFVVNYFFEDDFVFEVEIDIYLKSIDKADKISEQLVKVLSEKFGKSIMESGFYVWKYQLQETGETAYLSLIDESEIYNYGKINITNYLDFNPEI
jgi:hypothetical protein